MQNFTDQYGKEIFPPEGTQVHWRPTVRMLVIHEQKILFVKARTHKRWVFPGGALEFGETPFEGGIREVREETGLDVRIVSETPISVGSNLFFDEQFFQTLWMFFVAVPNSLSTVNVDDSEVEEVRWFQINELSKNGFDEKTCQRATLALNIVVQSGKSKPCQS